MSRVLNAMSQQSATTWNGAVSNSTTGFDKGGAVLDYWSKAGTYQGRSQEQVNADMAKIFADDEELALRAVFSLRLITRKPSSPGIEEVQTGYGRKDEFFKAFNWLLDNRRSTALKNLALIPVFGCWKDFLQEPLLTRRDLRNHVYELCSQNMADSLLRKYLPQMYSKGKKRRRKGREVVRAHTPKALALVNWARGLANYMHIDNRTYRELKRDGTAHTWQQNISRREWDSIDFTRIPGKAMLNMVSRKGKDKLTAFERHGQVERLKEWVAAQPCIKFTGYPYELLKAARGKPNFMQQEVYNKQFLAMLEPMKGHKLGNVLCAIDTSYSMTCPVAGDVAQAIDVCLSMGISFSSMNQGWFKDVVVAFNSHSSPPIRLAGSFCDRVKQLEMVSAAGSTNFQSVIDTIVEIRRKHPEIPINEFPETLLVVSDMQFNPAGSNAQTNYREALRKLGNVGLGDLRIIWWWVNGEGSDFPSTMHDKGTYMISGFDPINLKALMGLTSEKKDFVAQEKKEETPLDGMKNVLSQPIFDLIQR